MNRIVLFSKVSALQRDITVFKILATTTKLDCSGGRAGTSAAVSDDDVTATSDELHKRDRHYIETHDCVNK